MEVVARATNIRVSPQKMRLVCDAVRGKPVNDALAALKYMPQKSAVDVAKVVKSAAANAEHNHDLDPDALYVKRIFADEGPTLKRWRARARGRVNRRLKRSSHLTVIVDELNGGA